MGMNKKVKTRYAGLAQYLGMHFDEESGAIYGEREGFSLHIGPYVAKSNADYDMVAVSVGIQNNGAEIKREDTKAIKKAHKQIFCIIQEKNTVSMVLKRCTRLQKTQENVQDCLPAFISFLKSRGFVNGCEHCGEAKETECCYVAGNVMCLCEECYTATSQNMAEYEKQNKGKKENLIGGIVGAVLGSLIGVACIILLSQLGYVAALSGVVMAVCALRGYEMLGGKLTKRGIIISAVIMIVMTYVGDRLDWAIMIARELGTDIFYSYRLVPVLLTEEIIDIASYVADLVLVYVFLLLGAVPTIRNTMRGNDEAGKIKKLY